MVVTDFNSFYLHSKFISVVLIYDNLPNSANWLADGRIPRFSETANLSPVDKIKEERNLLIKIRYPYYNHQTKITI